MDEIIEKLIMDAHGDVEVRGKIKKLIIELCVENVRYSEGIAKMDKILSSR